jgi:hypothetical protein
MKQQIVDPFIPAQPRPVLSLTSEPSNQPRSKALVNTSGSLDGVMNKPQPRTYRPPAGPLHLRYLTKPAAVAKVAVKPMDIKASLVAGGRPPSRTLIQPAQAVKISPPVRPRQTTTMDITSSNTRSAAGHQLVAAPAPAVINHQRPPSQISEPQPAPQLASELPVKRPWYQVLLPGLLIVAAAVGLAWFSAIAGQIAIAVYAVLVFWRRWPSRQSFGLALVMFAGVAITTFVRTLSSLTANVAVFAFLLLCIGTLSLALELRRGPRQASR